MTVTGTVDGRRHDATALRLRAGTHRIERGTRLTFAAAPPSPPPTAAPTAPCPPPWRPAARNARCTPPTG